MDTINELILKSLENNGNVGSSSHLKIVCENTEPGGSDFAIPARYYKDKIVLLPVTPTKSFFYWEITDALLLSLGISLSDVQLHFFVLDDKDTVLCEIYSKFAVGGYYFQHTVANQTIYVALVPTLDVKNKILVSNKLFIEDTTMKFISSKEQSLFASLHQIDAFGRVQESHYSSKDLV